MSVLETKMKQELSQGYGNSRKKSGRYNITEGVDAIRKCWATFVAALGEDAMNLNNGVANGLSKKVEQFSFLALACLLCSVLPQFTKLSQAFQTEKLLTRY